MPIIVEFDELATPQRVTRVTGSSQNPQPYFESGRTDYLVDPDLSALEGIVPRRFWKHEGGLIVAWTQQEQDDFNAAQAAAADAGTRAGAKENLGGGFESNALWWRAYSSVLVSEFNILRDGVSHYGGLFGGTGTSQSVASGINEVLADLVNGTAAPTSGSIISDAAGGLVTLVEAGDYLIDYGMSFSSSGTSPEWIISIYGNNTLVPQSQISREGTIAGDVSRTFIANTPVPNINLTIHVEHGDGPTRSITPQFWTITVRKLNSFNPRTLQQFRTAMEALVDDGSQDLP